MHLALRHALRIFDEKTERDKRAVRETKDRASGNKKRERHTANERGARRE